MRAHTAVRIPDAVLTSASEIPLESSAESGAPALPRAWNDLIIPTTVPNKPRRVPRVVIVAKIGRFCCNDGISRAVASSSCCWITASFCSLGRTVLASISLYLPRVEKTIAPTVPCCFLQSSSALATFFSLRAFFTSATNLVWLPLPAALPRAMKRSTVRVSTVKRQVRMKGTTKPPRYIVPRRLVGLLVTPSSLVGAKK